MCNKLGLLKRQILWQCPKDAAITHTKFKHEIQNIGEYDFTLDKVIKSHQRKFGSKPRKSRIKYIRKLIRYFNKV